MQGTGVVDGFGWSLLYLAAQYWWREGMIVFALLIPQEDSFGKHPTTGRITSIVLLDAWYFRCVASTKVAAPGYSAPPRPVPGRKSA